MTVRFVPVDLLLERPTAVLVLVAAIASAATVGCSKEDPLPPYVPPGSPCDTRNCVPVDPSAAVAVERDLGDGGPCGDPPLRFSIPDGAAAFSSILECGGNRVRCGTGDFRVTSTGGNKVRCAVTGSGPFHVTASVRMTSGAFFEVAGDVMTDGGSVTVSTSGGPDAGSEGPMVCVAKPQPSAAPFLLPGSIWATFDCTGDADASACGVRGAFVFEECVKEGDAGF